MNEQSFNKGVKEVLEKFALSEDISPLFSQQGLNRFKADATSAKRDIGNKIKDTIGPSLVEGYSNKHWSGGLKYDPTTHTAGPNMPRLTGYVLGTRQSPAHGTINSPGSPTDSYLHQFGRWLGGTDIVGRKLDQLGGGREAISKKIMEESKGLVNLQPDQGITIDRSRLPAYALSKFRNWLDTNPGKALGILSTFGVGLGALAMSGNNSKEDTINPPTAQGGATQASPGPVKPAPYAGREGYMFTQANKV